MENSVIKPLASFYSTVLLIIHIQCIWDTGIALSALKFLRSIFQKLNNNCQKKPRTLLRLWNTEINTVMMWQPLIVALTSLSSHPYYKVYIIISSKSHARFCTCKILLQALTLTCKDFYIVHNRACSSRNQMPPVLDIALQDQV